MAATELGVDALVAREAVARLATGELAALAFLEEVAKRVRRVVPYAAAGWLPTDPATLLHTGAFNEGVPSALQMRLIENELVEPDVAKFGAVAALATPVRRLSDATGGDLRRSPRYRHLYEPEGYGSEVRAAFRTGGDCWGVVCLARREGEPDFDDAETRFIAGVCDDVARGLRRAVVARRSAPLSVAQTAPGVIVVRADDTVASRGGTAERWLRELRAERAELPVVVAEIVRRARASATGGPTPYARARVASGRWLRIQGEQLENGDTAVVLEPARPAELAPIIVAAYGLTERERQVTALLTRGLAMDAITRRLRISKHTLRDHVKAIYAKCGVESRAELTALLFHEHFRPGLDVRNRHG